MRYEIKYKRMSDEKREDYIWRICSNKDNGLYELKWEDVKEILNSELGETYGESKWRKAYQHERRGYERAVEKNTDTQSELEELRLTKIEVDMASKKKQTEAIYTNRILREHAREEMLKDRVVSAISNAEKIPLPEFNPLEISNVGGKEYLLGITDIHAYKMFKSITNEYSKEILEDRMTELFDDVVLLVKQEQIETLVILNGGDNFEGLLRNSALAMLELGVIDTVVEFRRFIAKWLSDLSAYVKIKYIHLTSANHGEVRLLNMRAGQMPQEDFEKDIANYIQDILSENDRIEVIVPKTQYYHLKIAGQDVLCHHGHGIGNPKVYLDSMSRKLKVWFTSLIVGHLHSEKIETFYEDIDGGDIELLRLPSIVGSCTFSDKINKGAKSSAIIFRFDENKGRDREYKFVLN